MPDLGSAVGGILSIGSSVLGSKASSKAADAQTQASAAQANAILEGTKLSIDAQKEMYYRSRQDLGPWRDLGRNALYTLDSKMRKGPGQFVSTNDPGYKFGYEEFVEKPTLRTASATGRLRSGATQKALTRYAQDYASTKYDNFLSRYYDSLKPYQSMAGIGQTSSAQTANNAMATGGNIGNALQSGYSNAGGAYANAGDARASGYINQANSWIGGLTNMQNALLSYPLTQQPTTTNSLAAGSSELPWYSSVGR